MGHLKSGVCLNQRLSKRLFAVNTIQPGSFLTLHYRLAGPDGADVITTFNDKPATLTLGAGQLSPAIEARLLGLLEGTRSQFSLAPGEAFGPRSPEMVQRLSRQVLNELGDPQAEYSVGDVVDFPTPDNTGRFAGVVRAVGEGWLEFDFNHPLAGEAVTFEVQIIGVL
jgi:FKBP-type peptidyl-prolyl cis-trans isomerase SlpA